MGKESNMFTGIIEAVGTIRSVEPRGGDVRLHVATGKLDLSDVKLGDSIATNGVCLTAVVLPGDGFVADVSTETLARSTLKNLKAGEYHFLYYNNLVTKIVVKKGFFWNNNNFIIAPILRY